MGRSLRVQQALALSLFCCKVRLDPSLCRCRPQTDLELLPVPRSWRPMLQAQLLWRVKGMECVGLAHTQWYRTAPQIQAQPQKAWESQGASPEQPVWVTETVSCSSRHYCPLSSPQGLGCRGPQHPRRAWNPSTDWHFEPSLCGNMIFPCLRPPPLLLTQCAPQLSQYSTGLKGKLMCQMPTNRFLIIQ